MKKNIMKLFFILIILFVIVNIFYQIRNNIDKSYIVLDYDNILKIENEKVKKVSVNKIRYLNYTNSYLLNEKEKINGYLSINDESYEVKFYDKNMNEEYEGTIIIDKNNNIDRISTVTENLTSNDLNIIYKKLEEYSIDSDIDKNNIDITKSVINSNDAVYNILYYNNDQILSLIFIKNGNDIEEIYNKKVTEEYYGVLRGIIVLKNNSRPLILVALNKPSSDYSVCTSVYSYSENKYIPIINCEEE